VILREEGDGFSFHDFRARWLYMEGKKTVMRWISLGRSGRQILLSGVGAPQTQAGSVRWEHDRIESDVNVQVV